MSDDTLKLDAAVDSALEQPAIRAAAELYAAGSDVADFFRLIILLEGHIERIRDAASVLVRMLPVIEQRALADAVVLRLGELVEADAAQIAVLNPLLSGDERAQAKYCHVAGHGGKNALAMGDQVKQFASDESPLVRRRAIQALGRLAEHGLQSTEAIIAAATIDADESVRSEASRWRKQL